MIGYGKNAKTRYHLTYQSQWALCRDMMWLTFSYNDEKVLKRDAPHLSRCPRCWKGEK